MKTSHAEQLAKETAALKKDKEETVNHLNQTHQTEVQKKAEEHQKNVKSLNETFEVKMAKKEADHAKVLEGLEAER